MIFDMGLVVIISILKIINIALPNYDFPEWVYTMINDIIVSTKALNGVFPIDACFDILKIYIVLKLLFISGRFLVYLFNLLRGSGAESPI